MRGRKEEGGDDGELIREERGQRKTRKESGEGGRKGGG